MFLLGDAVSELLTIKSIILLIGVGILIVYKVLFKFPLIFGKRKRFLGKKGFAEVIGHRGSRDHGLPENTLAAFIDAAKAGVDMVELDVWLTKDNQVVVFHDSCLTRMTLGNHGAKIYELNYDELPDLIPSEEQSHRTSHYQPKHWNRIPLLSEVFENIPAEISFHIEFKMNSDLLISEVSKLISQHKRDHNVFWFSLDEKINSKLRKANPKIPTVTSVTGTLFVLFLYYTCLLPFYPLPDDVFGITLDPITMHEVNNSPLKGLPGWVKLFITYLFTGTPPYIMMAPALFEHLRARGVPVWFMLVNRDRELEIAHKYGATAVLTDRSGWLIERMKEKNIHFKKIE